MSRADALALAAQGWPVFPTRAKEPLTKNGFYDASTTPAADWPDDAQIAIAIPQGYVVVDVDTSDGTPKHPHDGFATLRELEAKHGALPPTLTCVSGRGGEHRWYRTNGAALIQRKLASGIDTRVGGKGYVVAPPSPHHETGKPYAWQTPVQPIADAPQWVIDALTAPEVETPPASGAWPTPTSDALVAARKWLAQAPPSIQGQDGSGALMKAAGVLVRGFALGPDVGSLVLAEYNARAVPPWSEHELARAIASATKSAREPAVGSMLPDVDLLASIRGPRIEPASPDALDIDEIFAPLPPIDYLVHGIGIVAGPPAMIAGYGFSGKTAAVQQMAIDLAREDHAGDWMNKRPVWGKFQAGRRARVLHLDYEQGQNLTRRRYQRLAHAAGITANALRGYLRLVPFPTWYTNTSTGYATLARMVEGFDLVIVDSFRASNPGLEENSSDAREPLDAMARLSEKTGAAFLVIHHARKPSHDKPGGAKMAIRGSGAIFDGCSSVLVFESEEKNAPKLVSHEKEKTSGVPVDDFSLVIEDVDVKAGLRVRAADLVIVTPAQRAAEMLKDDSQKIREWLATHLFFSNRAQIRLALNISNDRISAAMGDMLTRGEMINSGTQRCPNYHLSGAGR